MNNKNRTQIYLAFVVLHFFIFYLLLLFVWLGGVRNLKKYHNVALSFPFFAPLCSCYRYFNILYNPLFMILISAFSNIQYTNIQYTIQYTILYYLAKTVRCCKKYCI